MNRMVTGAAFVGLFAVMAGLAVAQALVRGVGRRFGLTGT